MPCVLRSCLTGLADGPFVQVNHPTALMGCGFNLSVSGVVGRGLEPLSWWWWWFNRLVVSNSCHPVDCSLLGSSVHGILRAKILEWIAISWDLPDPGIKTMSPVLHVNSLLLSHLGSPLLSCDTNSFKIGLFFASSLLHPWQHLVTIPSRG